MRTVDFDPAAMPVGATERLGYAWVERRAAERWVVGGYAGGRPAGGVTLARSPGRALFYLGRLARQAPAGKSPTADRHKRHPVTLRLDGADRAWYAAEAARLGLTPHALMVRVLGDYRAAHSLAPIAAWATLGEAEAEAEQVAP